MFVRLFLISVLLFALTATDSTPDGSLLFVEGGNQIVMDYTDSVYSHVALIFNIDGEPYVYEAVKPRCRKVKLKDYLDEIAKENHKKHKEMVVWVMRPTNLPKNSAKKMQEYCESQLGRKYHVNSFLSGKPKKSIHCGELTGRAMIEGGMKVEENPCRLSPQDIYELSPTYYHKAIRQ